MTTIQVTLAERSYPIYINNDFSQISELLKKHITGQQVFIVTDEHVAPLYLDKLLQALSGLQVAHLILPSGEETKTLATIEKILTQLLTIKQDRSTTMIALGGGVIGDMTGFAASCYRRGVAFIQIPTTLLAQVDSAIGGKTGVNHSLGKNMIGAFYQPKCVIADVTTLQSLPEREFKAGLAEVIKYGLLADAEFFAWLEQNTTAILQRDSKALVSIIENSCTIKADFVMRDEYEQNERALLNLGHTFGHAIEAATHYQSWLHGEAVAVGLLMAADLSVRLGLLPETDLQRIQRLLLQFGLPIAPPPSMTQENFLQFMSQDKKVLAGQLRLILLDKIGHAIINKDYAINKLSETIGRFVEAL